MLVLSLLVLEANRKGSHSCSLVVAVVVDSVMEGTVSVVPVRCVVVLGEIVQGFSHLAEETIDAASCCVGSSSWEQLRLGVDS